MSDCVLVAGTRAVNKTGLLKSSERGLPAEVTVEWRLAEEHSVENNVRVRNEA